MTCGTGKVDAVLNASAGAGSRSLKVSTLSCMVSPSTEAREAQTWIRAARFLRRADRGEPNIHLDVLRGNRVSWRVGPSSWGDEGSKERAALLGGFVSGSDMPASIASASPSARSADRWRTRGPPGSSYRSESPRHRSRSGKLPARRRRPQICFASGSPSTLLLTNISSKQTPVNAHDGGRSRGSWQRTNDVRPAVLAS